MVQACAMSRPRQRQQQQQQQQLLTPGKQPLSPQLDASLITSAARKRKVVPGEPASPYLAPAPPASEEGKRQRTPSIDRGLDDYDAHTDALVRLRLQLGSPAAALMHAAATPADAPCSSGHGGGAAMEADPAEPADAAPGGAAAGGRREQQPGPWQHPQAAAQGQQGQQHHGGGRSRGGTPTPEEELLFSPVFHLCRDDLAGHPACAEHGAGLPPLPPARPPAAAPPAVQQAQQGQQQQGARGDTENTASTDHSTGTSACLADADVSDASDDGGERDEAPLAAALASAPAAPGPSPPAEQEGGEEGCEAEYLEFDPLLFIKRLPPLERCVPPRRDFLLPTKTRRSKQKTLVLDLDETLVHSTLDGYCRPDFTFPVEVGSMTHMVSVRQRPHLHTFLERVAQLYEVVVFTASQRVYAEQLLNIVDPQRRLVRHRVYRESCVFWEGNYLKDLTVLGRDLAHTIIVDNSPQAFGFQLDNGIPIESWYDDDRDEELLKLIPFLEKVAHAEDVRPHIQKRYRLRRLVDAAHDPEELLVQEAQEQAQQAQQQAQLASPAPPTQQG
ncbi:hypothetical protein ABPG75_011550 [Micractinium tetrahymenae]